MHVKVYQLVVNGWLKILYLKLSITIIHEKWCLLSLVLINSNVSIFKLDRMFLFLLILMHISIRINGIIALEHLMCDQ